jgi:hypothetical protein
VERSRVEAAPEPPRSQLYVCDAGQ